LQRPDALEWGRLYTLGRPRGRKLMLVDFCQ
jgi:hypothetical protein